MKAVLIIFGITIGHFTCEKALFILILSNGLDPSELDEVLPNWLEIVSTIHYFLTLPFVPILFNYESLEFKGESEHLPFIINSFIWGISSYLLVWKLRDSLRQKSKPRHNKELQRPH